MAPIHGEFSIAQFQLAWCNNHSLTLVIRSIGQTVIEEDMAVIHNLAMDDLGDDQ